VMLGLRPGAAMSQVRTCALKKICNITLVYGRIIVLSAVNRPTVVR